MIRKNQTRIFSRRKALESQERNVISENMTTPQNIVNRSSTELNDSNVEEDESEVDKLNISEPVCNESHHSDDNMIEDFCIDKTSQLDRSTLQKGNSEDLYDVAIVGAEGAQTSGENVANENSLNLSLDNLNFNYDSVMPDSVDFQVPELDQTELHTG